MGAFVGTLDIKDGEGIMTNIQYINGKDVQPTDEEVAKLRPVED